MLRLGRHRQCLKKLQDFRPIPEVPAGKFADDKGMTYGLSGIQ